MKTLTFRISLVLSIIVIATLGLLTFRQTHVWTNSKTLFAHTIKTLNDDPYRSEIYLRLGWVYQLEGNTEEAMRQFKNAVRINPGFMLARTDICRTLLQQKKTDEAIACFNDLLQQNENSADVHYGLAVALITQKKYDNAIKHFARVLELNPKYPNIHYTMGTGLLAAGHFEEAAAFLNEALKTSANQAEVYVKLGTAYTKLGKREQAFQNLTKSLDLDPNNIDALNNLAWLLATVDDVSIQDANRAIKLAERACELTRHKDPEYLDTLAAAYAAAGRFDDAVTTARQAVDFARAGGREELANEIQNRMKLYQSGRRYHQK
jgi:protein O-mannosyl-transferase